MSPSRTKPTSRKARRRESPTGAVRDLEPTVDPRGGVDLASSPITDGSVIDKVQFPTAIKTTLPK